MLLSVLVHDAYHLALALRDRIVGADGFEQVEDDHGAVREEPFAVAFGVPCRWHRCGGCRRTLNAADGLPDHHALDMVPVTVPVRIGDLGFGRPGLPLSSPRSCGQNCAFIGFSSLFQVGDCRTEVEVERLATDHQCGHGLDAHRFGLIDARPGFAQMHDLDSEAGGIDRVGDLLFGVDTHGTTSVIENGLGFILGLLTRYRSMKSPNTRNGRIGPPSGGGFMPGQSTRK